VGCYVVFAGLILLLPGRKFGLWRWVGAVLAVIGAVIVVTHAPRFMNTTHDYAFPRAVYGFFLGAALQGVWLSLPRLKGVAATVLELATITVICLFIAWAQGAAGVLVTLFFVVGVWVFAGEDGAVSRLLDARPLVTLGRWSFSIYMVHMFVLTVMLIIARKAHWMPGGRRVDFGSVWLNDLFAIGMFGLIVVLAVLAHKAVEVPAQKLIDRWTKPKA
jgi:peptidoglycan/LPS O-acetylase OafA/YrhL